MKKALVLATFGSTHLSSLTDSLNLLIEDLSEKYPDYQIKVGFTSNMIVNSLKKLGISIKSVDSLLEELKESEYDKVLVFANFLIPGTEYNKLIKTVEKFENSFSDLSVTEPYIASKQKLEKIATVLRNQIPEYDKNKFYLFMGHGSDHPENRLYYELNKVLRRNSLKNMQIACIDGEYNFKSLLNSNILNDYKEIELQPFLLISGDHVKNDMIENEDSWLNQLRNLGFQVSYSDQPLLKYKDFRNVILI